MTYYDLIDTLAAAIVDFQDAARSVRLCAASLPDADAQEQQYQMAATYQAAAEKIELIARRVAAELDAGY